MAKRKTETFIKGTANHRRTEGEQEAVRRAVVKFKLNEYYGNSPHA